MSKIKYAMIAVVTFVVMIFTSQGAYAEQDEWYNREYNFKTIKKIVLNEPKPDARIKDELATRRVQSMFKAKVIDSNTALRFMTVDEINTAIHADQGINMAELQASDKSKYVTAFNENVGKQCDAILDMDIVYMGYRWRHVPARTYTTTKEKVTKIERIVNGVVSTTYIKEPVTEYHFEPAHDVEVVDVGIKFRMTDAKTGKEVWVFSDMRSRDTGGTSTVDDVLGRIMNSFKGKLKSRLE